MSPDALLGAAEARREAVVTLRRRLHQIPELAFAEVETTRLVAAYLSARGIAFTPAKSGTGGVAVVGRGEPRLLLRADLDALPVEEPATAPFGSRHPGRMHACGHDAHAAMLAVAAELLAVGTVPLEGSVVCLFQPAEEGGGGCRRLLEDGLLEEYPVRAAVALHVWPGLATGTVGVRPGPLMAGMDRVRVAFRGRGGHGAYPHACVDPVVMAAEAVLAFQSLVSRRVDPLEPAVLTLGSIHGGTAPNVIPELVELDGSLRYYAPEVRETLVRGVGEVAAGIAAAHGGEARVEVDAGYPVTRNDPEITRRVGAALARALGPDAVRDAVPTMGSEDMSFLLDRVPGCYLHLGCSPDPARAAPLHSPRFAPDEACLPIGVAALLAAAAALAGPEGRSDARTLGR